MADGEVVVEIRGDSSNLDNDLSTAESKVSKSTGNLSKIALGAGAAIGGALIATGVQAFGLANDMDKACNQIIASTGASVEETERYQSIIENIYGNNYGEGFEDIANNIALVNQQMGDLDDSEMQRIVEKGYLMQDTFGIEMTESIRGVDAMMSQFGISSEQAYELMAQGAKDGLNQNGDLADQLAQYSVYYSDLGYSAEEMFNAVANGSKDGAYQIDYLNDAIKEFGICSKDGSDASSDAFKALGLNSKKMTEAFANGGDGAKKAFDDVANALKDVDDKVLQNQIGVSLFGTKFEDLGADAILALTDTQGAIDGTLETLSEMENVKYDSVGEMFEGIKRSVELLLLPLGEQLIPILTEIIESVSPVIEEVLPIITGLVLELMPSVQQIIESVLPPLIDLVLMLVENLLPILDLILPTLILLIEQLLPPIIEILNQVLPPLIDILNVLLEPILELIEQLLPPLISLFDALAPCIKALMPILTFLANIIAESIGDAINFIMPLIENFLDYLSNIISFITNVFTGNWEGAWKSAIAVFKNVFNQIPLFIEGILNQGIGVINKLISGVNKITGVIGIKAIPSITKVSIPRYKVGIDYVPEDEMPAYLHKGEAVLTASEAEIYRNLGGKGSLERMLSASVPQTAESSPVSRDNNDDSKIVVLLNTIILKLNALANLTIQMDKQKVGKLVAPTVNKELGNTSNLEERGKF